MPFLFEIVANDRNGIDVDKCVYTLICVFGFPFEIKGSTTSLATVMLLAKDATYP
jgi:hypothetical protein